MGDIKTTKLDIEIVGLILNFIGAILFGISALDRTPESWEDIGNTSDKARWLNKLAWFGLTGSGFGIQIYILIKS